MIRTCVSFFTAVLAVGILSACGSRPSLNILPTDEPPGVGERANKGYAFSEPIITALEEYRADNGAYPAAIADLVPNYLADKPTSPEGLDFSYSSTGDGYSFSFHYLGPGMNTCTFKPGLEWHCSGAF